MISSVWQRGANARVAKELVVAPGGLHRWADPDRANRDHELDRAGATAGQRGDVSSFGLGPQSEASWIDVASARQQCYCRDGVVGKHAVVAAQETVADCSFVVDERDNAAPGERLRGWLQLLPAAVPRSFQHDQRWATFRPRSRPHHEPVQDNTSAADEGHLGGRDGLRLGGGGRNRDTNDSEDGDQQQSGAHPPTPTRVLYVVRLLKDIHHSRNRTVR